MRKIADLRTLDSTISSRSHRTKNKSPTATRGNVTKAVKFPSSFPKARRTEKRVRRAHKKVNSIQALIENFNEISLTKKIYNLWADDYDRDMQTVRYRAPEYIAAILKYDLGITTDAKILDIGCGTGLVGKELKQLRYVNVHGVDISPDMILHAQRKDCYISCRVIDDLQGIDEEYDAVIMCSVFGAGHITPESATCLPSVARPNGYIVIAQLSPKENPQNKPLQEFVEALGMRTKAQSLRVEPIQRYFSGRFGLIAIISTGSY